MKAHILVVDNNPRITDLLRRILAYEGCSVAIAASGNEALDRLLERPPDLIVLDIMLPGLDGLEVAQRLRAAGDNVPILMLTARDAVTDRVKGQETGADDYLVKLHRLRHSADQVHREHDVSGHSADHQHLPRYPEPVPEPSPSIRW